MNITEKIAEKVRKKRAKEKLGKMELSKILGIAPPTLVKVENGNYNAPKRIYEAVMTWLIDE